MVTIGDGASARAVSVLLDDLFVSPPTWPHTTATGELGPAVSRISRERGASMLLIGMKSPMEQRNKTVELARWSPIPVLAVPSHMSALPRRALLALDFREPSLYAANTALRLLARPAVACMVSASPRQPPEPHVGLLFDAVENGFGADPELTITRHTVAGEPAAALLQFATAQSVDLIALGRCGRTAATYGNPGSMGHVARAILAATPCSVLSALSSNLT